MMARRFASLIVAAALLASVGCDGEDNFRDTGVPDAAAPDAGDSGLEDATSRLPPVIPPDIPWLEEDKTPTTLTPCPTGWREVVVNSDIECDPYPADGQASCAPGEAHFPGEPGCRTIGSACPVGDYAMGLPPEGSVIYVNPAAAAGGSGSLSAPLERLSSVRWTSLAPGTTIALAKGTHEGTLHLKGGVRVVGACVRETRVIGNSGPHPAVLTMTGGGSGALVENLTIEATQQRGVQISQGFSVTLEGVLVEGARGIGIVVSDPGSTVVIRDTVVRDTQPQVSDGKLGRGLHAQRGGHLEATRLLVVRSHEAGAFVADDGTMMTLTDTSIRDTQPQERGGEHGHGVHVQEGAEFVGSRLSLVGNHTFGVSSSHRGTVVTLVDTVIADTKAQASDDTGGQGIHVETGSELIATRLLVSETRSDGIVVASSGSRATLTDTVIRDTVPQAGDSLTGKGLNVAEGAVVTASRLLVVNTHDVGVFVAGGGSILNLTDAMVRDTAPLGSDGGRGINVQERAALVAARIAVMGSNEVGVFASDLWTTAGLTDLVIQDTATRAFDPLAGRGLNVQEGAELTATRTSVLNSYEMGVFASGEGAMVVLTDTRVRNLISAGDSAVVGGGVSTELGASLQGERLFVEDVINYGVSSVGEATIDLTHLSVVGVHRVDCPDCATQNHGYGLSAAGAALRVTGFDIRNAAVCGVFVSALDGYSAVPALDLADGIVSGSDIGACVQAAAYDFDRLTARVEYRNNGTNLDTTSLPVPQPLPSLGD